MLTRYHFLADSRAANETLGLSPLQISPDIEQFVPYSILISTANKMHERLVQAGSCPVVDNDADQRRVSRLLYDLQKTTANP